MQFGIVPLIALVSLSSAQFSCSKKGEFILVVELARERSDINGATPSSFSFYVLEYIATWLVFYKLEAALPWIDLSWKNCLDSFLCLSSRKPFAAAALPSVTKSVGSRWVAAGLSTPLSYSHVTGGGHLSQFAALQSSPVL